MKPAFPTRLTIFSLVICGISCSWFANPAAAQTKYDPDDESVRQIVLPMVKHLRTEYNEGTLGRRVLIALAILEATKRYDGYVPKDDPIIVDACNQVLAELQTDNWFNESTEFNTMYGPCLALILLCDVDSKKYKEAIEAILAFIDSRQLGHGPWGYRTEKTVGDTSQVQYVALAIWVAHKYGFEVKPKWGKGALDWLASTQRGNVDNTGDGGWGYKDGNTQDTRQPIVAAGASTVYMVADWFGLNPRAPKPKRKRSGEIELPRDVSIHVTEESGGRPKNVVIPYDKNKLGNCKVRANRWFERNFTPKIELWNYYFLYAFERYAFFREGAEGPLGGPMRNWYDQGVERLKADMQSNQDGSTHLPRGNLAEVDDAVTTALGVLFLVRSTEILSMGNKSGTLKAGQGLPGGNLQRQGNRLTGDDVAQNTEDLMKLIDNPSSEDDLNKIAESFTTLKLTGDEDQKAKQRAWIRGLVTHQKPGPRYIGVKFLSNKRDIDNVPALIYALSDPRLDIAMMAHNGLRYISRKIDTISLPPSPKKEDFLQIKLKWEKWYLSVRPNAELLDK